MRKYLISIFAALCLCQGMAQNKQLLYGFKEIPQSLLQNPGGRALYDKHFGIPLFSQVHLTGGSSGVSVYDIFATSGPDINERIRTKIFELKNSDFFTANQQLEIVNFGWRNEGGIYFSGGLYQEFDFIAYFPRDLAILAWEGNRDYIDYEFDLGEVNSTGDLLTVYHFGVNKEINKKLTVGARVKIYSSIMNYRSTDNSGSFVTRVSPEGPNIYSHDVENVNVTVKTSGISDLDEGSPGGKLIGRALFSGNMGVGLDLGATYEINQRLTASASVLDLGAIFHTTNIETYEATGSYRLNGIEFLFPAVGDGEPTFPYYDDLEDEIEREVPIDTLTNSYTHMRPVKLNLGLGYSFGKALDGGDDCDCRNRGGGIEREQEIGIQLYGVSRPKSLQTAATLYYYRRIWESLTAKITYTADPYSLSNLGLGISSQFGRFNFYIAADNLLQYTNLAKAKSVSLQLGFNINIYEE